MKRIAIWILVAFWMLEELLWDALNWIEERIAFLRLVRIFEQWVAARTPWQAAVLMLTPAAMLFPAKILGLWLLTSGHTVAGLGLILLAKVIGTAIVARMYRLCKDALLTLSWFAWGHRLVLRFSAWVHTTEAWQMATQWKTAISSRLNELKMRWSWHNR